MTPLDFVTRLLRALLVFAGICSAGAHELAENRATLVLRDQNHVSVTLFIGFSEALHRALAPESSFQEFVLTFSALPPDSFKTALFKAEGRFEAETRLVTDFGQALVPGRWTWPEPARVQAVLRERAMQVLVAPGDHPHEEPLEVRAECQAAKAIQSVRMRFPQAFGRLLVVSYRPKQIWIEPQGASAAITF